MAEASSSKKKIKKKGKFRKNKCRGPVLSEDDLHFLLESTSFSSQEIREWHKGFMEDNPDGTLSKPKMMDMYGDVNRILSFHL